MIPFEFTERQAFKCLLEMGYDPMTVDNASGICRDWIKLQKVLNHPGNKLIHKPTLKKYEQLFNNKWAI